MSALRENIRFPESTTSAARSQLSDGRGAHSGRPSSVSQSLVLQDRKLVPVGVVEGVRLRAADVRLGQKDANAVDEGSVLRVVDHEPGRLLVVGECIFGL